MPAVLTLLAEERAELVERLIDRFNGEDHKLGDRRASDVGCVSDPGRGSMTSRRRQMRSAP